MPPAPAEFSIRSQVSPVVAAVEDPLERSGRPFGPDLEAGAEVRADVEDHAVRLDRGGGIHRRAHRRDRLLVDLVVGRCEVAEVERVADDAADPVLGALRLERLDRLRLVVRRPPHARALGEHLDAVAADRDDPVDRGVDAAAR